MTIFHLLAFVIGYILAMIVYYALWNPEREWKKGYECAKKRFSDWDKGYNEGWEDGNNNIIKEKAYENLKKERDKADFKDLLIELY